MKTIGVISDTHLKTATPALERIIDEHFSAVDFVIHAGDMVTLDILDAFYARDLEVIGVAGNMDPDSVCRHFPRQRTVEVDDIHIGIIHGWGSPHGIRSRIRAGFEDMDVIVYGHTHEAYNATEGGILFFNPGSATNARFSPRCSVGILEVDGACCSGRIIPLS